ncbi:MAG: endonuclease NucS [Candidatus Bathyarchaeia archaeon]
MVDELADGKPTIGLPFSSIIIKFKESLRTCKTIVIVGNCMVDYTGRAKSTLTYGDRVVLIKQDGALLIHRPEGYLPVNWQPSRCHFHLKENNGLLELTSIRVSPSEKVLIRFRTIYSFTALRLKDDARFFLYASELDIREALILKPDLLEPGFRVLRSEKRVNPGFIDIFGQDKNGRKVVVEIKRNTAGRGAVIQLWNYIKAVGDPKSLRGIIAAPSLGKGCQRLMKTLNLEFRQIDPQVCSQILSESKKDPNDKSIGEYF